MIAKAAAVAGTAHWGIVLVPPARFGRRNVGLLVEALERLLDRLPDEEAIKSRAIVLQRA